jgi:hypothetical protein
LKSDQIELEIIKFIEMNPGKTINRVAEIMSEKGISSRMTTLKKIDNLKSTERGLIEDRQEGNSFHRLYINKKSEYKLIDKQLSEIELNILRMRDNIVRYEEVYRQNDNPPQALEDLMIFIHVFEQSIDSFLHALLLRINNTINSETDRQILFGRVIKLMVFNDMLHTYRESGIRNSMLKELKEKMSSRSFITYTRNNGIKISAMENFIRFADDFTKKFLSESEFKKQIHSLREGNRNNF